MKILEIMYSLSSGGAERFVVDISNELCKNKDNEVILVTIVDDKKGNNKHYYYELSPAVKYRCLGCKSGLSLSSFYRVIRIIKEVKPDIVHVHCNTMLIYIPALIYKRPCYIQTLHNVADKCLKFPMQKGINNWFAKKELYTPVTISESCQESYIKLYGTEDSVCIVNGRSPMYVTNEFQIVRHYVTSCKMYEDDKVFIHIARCAPQKNQTLLLEAFEQIAKEGIHFQLFIIGDGYRDLVQPKYEKVSQIHFIGVKQNVGDYLACSDYFVLSSLYEGLPLTLLEAMSMGVIPISTPVGGVPDVIIDGEIGFLSKSIGIDDFCNVLRRAIVRGPFIEKDKIISYYNANFSMTACARQYNDLFKRMLKKRTS